MANTTTTVSIVWGDRMDILAGTPVNAQSEFSNGAEAVGIVAEDVHRGAATVTVVTAGEWNEDYSAAHAGVRISDECKMALPSITFVDDDGDRVPTRAMPTPTSEGAGKYPVIDENGNTYTLTELKAATTEKAGLVKQAAAVADSEEETSPTTAEYNTLLAALRAAGIIAPTPEAGE